jgi:hypothetical protein
MILSSAYLRRQPGGSFHRQAEFPVFAVFPAVVFEWCARMSVGVSGGLRQFPAALDIAEKPVLSAIREVSALSALSAGHALVCRLLGFRAEPLAIFRQRFPALSPASWVAPKTKALRSGEHLPK